MCSSVEALRLIGLLGALRLDILDIVYNQGLFKFIIRNIYHIDLKQKDLEVLRTSKKPLQIIDVRSPTEYGICQLSGSISKISIATLLVSYVMTVNCRRSSQGLDSRTRKVFTCKF